MTSFAAARVTLALLFPALCVPANAATSRFVGHNQVLPRIAGVPMQSRLPAASRMGVSVVLEMRDAKALDALIASQHDASSPEFLRYLTPEEFGRRFGVSDADYLAVADYLRGQGLQITATFPNRLCITAEGTAAQIERAFDVQLNRYNVEGRTVFANDRTPSLPAALGARLLSVQGLTDAIRMKSMDGTGQPNYHTPVSINRIYNFLGLRNAGYDGTGQTIAIYSLADYSDTNLAYYAAGIASSFTSPRVAYPLDATHVTRVNIDNGDSTSGSTDYSVEADLDTQLCLGTAPAAGIQVWIARNGSMGVYNIYSAFANQTAVKIMSSSWGINEGVFLPSDTADLDTYHAVFAQAASEGLSIFNSSGDDGSRPPSPRIVDVNHPASDPCVVAVGGTTLTTASGDTYGSEKAWGGMDTSVSPAVPYGTGGGLSSYFSRPVWQAGPGVINSSSTGRRQVPDISLDADPNTGYIVRLTSGTPAAPGWYLGGGTSASAPEWAAGTALLQQAIGKAFFISPLLYKIYQAANGGSPFHDVVAGNNGDYACTAGWDYPTGLGTVNFGGLLLPLKRLVTPLAGDINLDGKVDISDATAGLQIVAGLQTASVYQVASGDVLKAGQINLPDVLFILKGIS